MTDETSAAATGSAREAEEESARRAADSTRGTDPPVVDGSTAGDVTSSGAERERPETVGPNATTPSAPEPTPPEPASHALATAKPVAADALREDGVEEELAEVEPEGECDTAALCANCGDELAGPFCAQCGQKDVDPLPLSQVITEALDGFFSLESRSWRTVWLLLRRPGFLTREYFAGRRARYVAPLRLYLFVSLTSFVLMGVFGWIAGDELPTSTTGKGVNFSYTIDPGEEGAVADTPSADVDVASDVANVRPTDPAAGEEVAATEDGAAAVDEQISGASSGRTVTGSANTLQEAVSDMMRGFADGLAEAAGPDGLSNFEAFLHRRFTAIATDTGAFFAAFRNRIPQAVFFMVPILAVLLKLAYWRRRLLLVHHLVFSLHIHAVGFLAILFDSALNAANTGLQFGQVLLLVYLFMALRRFYGGGRFKTFLKQTVLASVYLVVFGLVLSVVLFLASLSV